MAKRYFPARNNMTSAKSLWYYRAKYKLKAYPENQGDGGPEVKDLGFFERTYYGLIDQRDKSITLDPTYLKPFNDTRSQASTLVAADFVVDAFKNMARIFEQACGTNYLKENRPYFSKLRAVRAYTSPRTDYETYLNSLLSKMNTAIIPIKYDIKNILSFDDYVNTFLNYYSNNVNQVPLTLTKWCRSYYSSVFHSGLAISIADLPIGTDQEKVDLFIDDYNYDFYRDVAINSGFSVMKNAPWVLIADLQSPGITKTISKPEYGFKNLKDIFDKRYIKTSTYEIDILQELFYIYYSLFTIQYPRTKVITVCNNKTIQEYLTRPTLTRANYYAEYTYDYWLDILIKLKNSEENQRLSTRRMEQMGRNAKNIHSSLDKAAATAYIDKEYGNQTWNKPYGYGDNINYNLKKRREVPITPSGGGGGSSY